MSTRIESDLRITRKGHNDRRYQGGDTIYLRLMPDSRTDQRIMVRRRDPRTGAPYDLFLTDAEAYYVADALDDILSYIERST